MAKSICVVLRGGESRFTRVGVLEHALFLLFAPLEGWRHVDCTDRHTALDYAQILNDLSDTHFPDAKKIVLIQNNLNTDTPASPYQALPPAGPPSG